MEEFPIEKYSLVIYRGRPAMVTELTTSGAGVTLKLWKNHYITVLRSDVKPYTGKEDAVGLGLRTAKEA